MKGPRSIILLGLVLGGLMAYIYFVTWKQVDDDGKKRQKVFAALQSDAIEEIDVHATSGETTTLKKDGGGWQVTAPVMAAADEAEVASLTNSLSSIDITRVIDEHPSDLKDYGLTKPRIEIDFRTKGVAAPQKLFIGDKTPTGGDVFAMKHSEPRVFVIPAYLESTFDRGTFNLRDKTLVQFDRNTVDALDVMTSAGTVNVVKDGTDWRITRPVKAGADFGAVLGLINKLQGAKAKTIASNSAGTGDLKKFGLDKPSAKIVLTAGSTATTLLIGKQTSDNQTYAYDTLKPYVVTIDGALAAELTKTPDDFRRKALFELRSFTVKYLEITKDGQTYAFEQGKGEGDVVGKWTRLKPTKGDPDRDKFEVFLGQLSTMRAIGFNPSRASTGVDSPVLTVYARFDDGKGVVKEETVTFGRGGSNVYASRPGEPDVAQASAADFLGVLKHLDEVSK